MLDLGIDRFTLMREDPDLNRGTKMRRRWMYLFSAVAILAVLAAGLYLTAFANNETGSSKVSTFHEMFSGVAPAVGDLEEGKQVRVTLTGDLPHLRETNLTVGFAFGGSGIGFNETKCGNGDGWCLNSSNGTTLLFSVEPMVPSSTNFGRGLTASVAYGDGVFLEGNDQYDIRGLAAYKALAIYPQDEGKPIPNFVFLDGFISMP